MCGIVGLIHGPPQQEPDEGLLRLMAARLSHRGPDGSGFHVAGGIGFGHARLAIVDLAGGVQPMANEDGSVVVTFNGEIYNHAELRRELEAAGHNFATRSDTESIIHGWEEWGVGVLSRLRGMFAFALWDRHGGQVLLARDRLGEKPLHYAIRRDGSLAFASEIGALRVLPDVSPRIDPVALEDYLALGYIPDPATIYQDIRRLPAGHYALLNQRQDLTPAPRRYWHVPVTAAAEAPDAPLALLDRLRRSVSERLMSDVPLGAFLSGGIDSGIVVALAAQAATGSLATFTIGFPGPSDERAAAALVARRHGTHHTAEAATSDYLAAARQQARIFGEPFADHSAVPTLAVCRLARRHATVALSGDGGDEVFAGYRRYRWHLLAEGARRWLPGGARRRVFGTLARLYPKLDRAPRWLRAKHTLTEVSLDSAVGYYRTVCRMHDARRRGLMSAEFRTATDGHDPGARFAALMDQCDPGDPLLQAQYADMHTYLPGDILTKVDRTSMAVSLEVRPPLLDHELVAWGMALPARLKLRGSVGKHVLRAAAEPLLPAGLASRKKQGFADDIGAQLRAQADRVRERILSPAMLDSGWFTRDPLARLVDEHASGRADHGQALWQLLVLEGFLAGTTLPGEATVGRRELAHA